MTVSDLRIVVLLFAMTLVAFSPADSFVTAQPSVNSAAPVRLERAASEPTAGWSDMTQTIHPPGVAGSMMTYDAREGVFVLFGGSDGDPLNVTWILDPQTGTWTELHPALSPPARADGMLVYDSSARAIVLFGGWYEIPGEYQGDYYSRLADTWAFYVGNGTWIERHPDSSPSPRSDSAVAYDETEGITLLFGGFDGANYLGDMWYYDFEANTWSSRPSLPMPSPRADGRMTYDPSQQAFFLFSGNDYSDPSFNFHHLADMWRYAWLTNEWVQIFPDLLPMPRDYPVFITDTRFGELLLTGGYGNRTILGDIWSFNTTEYVWRNITTFGGPSARMAAVGGYDSIRGMLVIFGGGDDYEVKDDTWFFRYPPPLVGAIFVSSPDPIAGQPVSFSSELSGGSGSLRSASWDFGDGHSSSGPSAVHSFGGPGFYRIELIGQDTRGAEISVVMNLPVGVLLPLWLDISLLVLGVPALLISLFWLVKRLRKPPARS